MEIDKSKTPARVIFAYLVIGGFILIYGVPPVVCLIASVFGFCDCDQGKALWFGFMGLLGYGACGGIKEGEVKAATGALVLPLITLFVCAMDAEDGCVIDWLFMGALSYAIACMFSPTTLRWAEKVRTENKQKAAREEMRKKALTCSYCGGVLPNFNVTVCMHCGRDVHPVDPQNSVAIGVDPVEDVDRSLAERGAAVDPIEGKC